jgi:bicarbonate transport system ATP-binding protein
VAFHSRPISRANAPNSNIFIRSATSEKALAKSTLTNPNPTTSAMPTSTITNSVAGSSSFGQPAGAATPLLRFEQLGKVYATPQGPYSVLENINLEVNKGEFVCVIGHSGCGKSTLLNMVSGFASPSSGQVLLSGKPITKPGPDRMVVFQGYALLPWMTAYENIYLAIDSVKPRLPESEKREIVREHLEMVGLTAAADKKITQISGGMKQRVAIARALAIRPEVLILDEPFGALDEISRERLNDELLHLFQHEGFAGLFITHSIAEAVYMSTKVLVMSARPGRIIAEFDVPFDYPRKHDLRYEARFAQLCGEISHALRGAHE